MEDVPAVGGFDQLQRLIDELGPSTDFASFRRALERPLASALASVDLASSCVDVLAMLAADSRALAPRAACVTPASLVNGSGAVRLELPPPNPKGGPLIGSASHRLFGALSGRLQVTRWRHAESLDPSVLTPDAVLSPVGECTLGPGQTLATEAWSDVVELSGDAVVLVLRSAPCHPVLWQYDRGSLRPKGLIAATEQLARLEEALHILMLLGTAEDAESCRPLARHEFHSIRWGVVRMACQVGASLGYELLEAAVTDPHPHVRRTAQRTLSAATATQALV